jgi:hypothetical protein
MIKKLVASAVLSAALFATDSCDDTQPAPVPPPGPPVTTATQYPVITGQRHDIGFGTDEYRLLLDDPKGDRWQTVSKGEYQLCMRAPNLRYPQCALGGK